MPKQFPAARSLKSLTGALVSLQFESCHVFPPSLDSSHHCSRLQADLILYTARVTIESCEAGPDHDKRFIVEVKVGGLTTRGEGSSKKEAQQQAARHALRDFPPAA